MPLSLTRNHRDTDFHQSWWESCYLPAILLSCWTGIMWSLIALFVSMTWDLDQSWYDNSPAYLLPLRIALLWPVWGAVQIEDALTALGWQIDGAWFLLLFVIGVLPVLAAGVLWTYLNDQRR